MRGDAHAHTLVAPKDIAGVLDLLADTGAGYKLLAGGTDMMVAFERGLLREPKLVSIWHLRELRGIAAEGAHLLMGALTTYTDLIESPLVDRHAPTLAAAARDTAAVAIRNRGTIGGNIANASPAADLPPALLAHDCEVELLSKSGSRWVDYASFHTGYKTTVMRPDELIGRVRVPLATGALRHFYRKVGTRKAQAISKVCIAATVRQSGQTRIAFGSVAPTVVRARAIEQALEAALKQGPLNTQTALRIVSQGVAEATPIDDIRSTADYRKRVTANLLAQCLASFIA
jgi:CO/xanthine dehydrogenase FAD-binding subunit